MAKEFGLVGSTRNSDFEMIYAPNNVTITAEMEEEYTMRAFGKLNIKKKIKV